MKWGIRSFCAGGGGRPSTRARRPATRRSKASVKLKKPSSTPGKMGFFVPPPGTMLLQLLDEGRRPPWRSTYACAGAPGRPPEVPPQAATPPRPLPPPLLPSLRSDAVLRLLQANETPIDRSVGRSVDSGPAHTQATRRNRSWLVLLRHSEKAETRGGKGWGESVAEEASTANQNTAHELREPKTAGYTERHHKTAVETTTVPTGQD